MVLEKLSSYGSLKGGGFNEVFSYNFVERGPICYLLLKPSASVRLVTSLLSGLTVVGDSVDLWLLLMAPLIMKQNLL